MAKETEEDKKPSEIPASLTSFLMNPLLFPGQMAPYEQHVNEKLHDPNLLEWISDVLSTRIVGEETNKLTLFLVALSYKTDDPQSVIVQGPPSAGKSWLTRNVLRLFPNVINLSRITHAVLDRLGTDLSHYILYISELGGHEQATPTLRVMLSEGELRLATIDRETWQPKVIETLGSPVYVTTTIQDLVEPQLGARTWRLDLDLSKEQTRRILAFQARQAASVTKDEYTEDEMVLRCLIYKLKPYQVLVPYAEKLSELFPIEEPQARRDFKRLMAMIKCLALLFQEQRIKVESNGETVLLANLSDLANALKLVKPILFTTLYGLPKKAFEILNIIKDSEGEKFAAKEIAPKVRLSQSRARRIMNGLVDREFLLKDETHRVHLFYWSGKSLEEPCILTTHVSEEFFSEKEFEKWLISNGCIYSGTLKQLYETYISNKPSELLEQMHTSEKKLISNVLDETEPKETCVEETHVISMPKRWARKPTLAELEDVLRNTWRKGTTEEFYELIHEKSGLDRTETAEFVARLIDEGKMGYDPEGWLVWVR